MTTTSLTLLDFYKAIEQTSSMMLAAAHLRDWDAQLSLEERAEKHRIMTAILRHDAQIRELAEPWLDELGERVHPHGQVSLH
jgi:flagellar protein FliT